MLLQFSQIFPFLYPTLLPVLPCSSIPPHLSSCPWVVHVSSLASLFPMLFLTRPRLFIPTGYASYSLCLPLTILPLPLPTENPPCDVHFSDFVPVLVVSLVFVFLVFLFFLGSFVDSCEFVVISQFIFFIFFFLDKSL